MKMISMERTKADIKAREAKYKNGPTVSEEEYPYGLCIHLGKEELEKLGMEVPDIGQAFTLTAEVKVTECRESASEKGGDEKSCKLQITEMALSQKKELGDMGMDEYAKARGKKK